MPEHSIILGDALASLRTLPPESHNCCVTSPPYFGLRDYSVKPSVWGGDPECSHDWTNEIIVNETRGNSGSTLEGAGNVRAAKRRIPHGDGRENDSYAGRVPYPSEPAITLRGCFCSECGAWLGCLGMEPTPDLYVEHVVALFHEIRRVLRPDGTLWLNLGDSYAASGAVGALSDKQASNAGSVGKSNRRKPPANYKEKDLIGIPWMVAFALRADGWYLRQDIVWSKPNPMPESVRDRCTKSHEYLFLLSKSKHYYYDAAAIAEPVAGSTILRLSQVGLPDQVGSARVPGKTNGNMKASAPRFGGDKYPDQTLDRRKSGNEYIPTSHKGSTFTNGKTGVNGGDRVGQGQRTESMTRNRRSVWIVATQPYKKAHFATFPEKLIEPCILAGCTPSGVVLDPFAGSGTTGAVCERLGRNSTLLELNPEYLPMIEERLAKARGKRLSVQPKLAGMAN